MKIKISNVNKTPFWGIPEADIHMSEEQPEVEFDPSKLTPYQQQTIWSALRMKTIESEQADDFNKEFTSMLKGYLEKRQQNQASNMKQIFGLEDNANKEAVETVKKTNEIKKVMEGSVSTLKKILPSYTAIDLELALKIEIHNKDRKSVIKLVNELINKQAKASVSKVERPNAPSEEVFQQRQVTKGENKALLSNLTGVRESDKEEVIIKIQEYLLTILKDIIADYSPPSGSVGVSLNSTIVVLFDRLMDTDDLEVEFFVSGPDTDQFIGPGVAEFNIYPDNVSQGDDFLESPGYQGIVSGTFSFETVSGATQMTFTPSFPMAALTQYTAHLPEADDANGTTYEGHVTFSWTTGSGSIEALPDTSSTSVLTSTVTSLSALDDLEVVKTTPEADSAEQELDLTQIEIELNKAISASGLSDNISVKTYPATDHPSASSSADGELAKKVTVDGKKIIIEI